MSNLSILSNLWDEIILFFGVYSIIEIIQSGNYDSLNTWDGIKALIAPILPILLLIEIIRSSIYKKFKMDHYRTPFLIFLGNRVISRFISIAAVSFCIVSLEPFALFQIEITWYWFIYAYIVWEFAHFIYHYLGHKVRLFWCLHSTHHAPIEMNLFVSNAHFFLEAPYADIIRTSICILAGLPPILLFSVMFVDGTWGTFIHVGENIVKDGRLGILNKFLLTPSHHRVHHAKNPLYMDTNFCNLLPIWDKAFGTFQNEEESIKIEYGITRPYNPQNYFDVYFGEIILLIKDIYYAPGILNKFKYLFMPPGWNHTGHSKTAKQIRIEYLTAEKTKKL
jgi:sterol desaturase/sphingolipid hydroxylase (fatty acid hydroxylase superfamily)